MGLPPARRVESLHSSVSRKRGSGVSRGSNGLPASRDGRDFRQSEKGGFESPHFPRKSRLSPTS